MTAESNLPALPPADIQAIILCNYRMPLARHFVLRIDNALAAGRVIANLLDDPGQSGLRVTAASHWSAEPRPDSCLNLGFTWQGLLALSVPLDWEKSFRSFPSFQQGAIGRAAFLHDVGAGAPDHWIGGLGPVSPGSTESDTQVILTLHATNPAVLESRTTQLRSLLHSEPSFTELSSHDGQALPGEKVHFGYRDGISEPRIRGATSAGGTNVRPDSQPEAPACQFVLGDDGDYNVPEPPELGLNGSFAAFRIIEQDVVGFENYLNANSDSDASKEKLAAQILGRWRNGTPLMLSPDSPTEIPDEQLNDFDYVATANNPDDKLGLRCPIGAHIRRVNPRGVPAPGAGSGHDHRLIRRGLPYGPEYIPGSPPDNVPRGLVGMFICADLFNQFEFVQNDWVNRGGFVSGLPVDHKDPLIGNNDPQNSAFEIPQPSGQKRTLRGFGSFTTTRGGAHLFLPSLTGLRFLVANQRS